MIDIDNIEQLKKTYFNDPTSLPTAFWKYENWLNSSRVQVDKYENNTAIILGNRILYSDFDKLPESISDDNIELVVSKNPLKISEEWNEEVFFKLYYSCKTDNSITPPIHRFKEVNNNELDEVFKFILDSYENTDITLENIKLWRESVYFDNTIWIWLIDSETDNKIALGICEHDRKNKEGILDWIQVNKDYRGKGYGKALIRELIYRMSEKVDIITVSGDCNNKTSPELLYRSCGFIGNQNWFIYKRK